MIDTIVDNIKCSSSATVGYDSTLSISIEPMLLIQKLKSVMHIFRLKIGTLFPLIAMEMKSQLANKKCQILTFELAILVLLIRTCR